jgi:hypothetical protein
MLEFKLPLDRVSPGRAPEGRTTKGGARSSKVGKPDIEVTVPSGACQGSHLSLVLSGE